MVGIRGINQNCVGTIVNKRTDTQFSSGRRTANGAVKKEVGDEERSINVLGIGTITQDRRRHYHCDRNHRVSREESSRRSGTFFLDGVTFLGSQGVGLREGTIIQFIWEAIGAGGSNVPSIETAAAETATVFRQESAFQGRERRATIR